MVDERQDRIELGHTIRGERARRGWTQRQLADRAGVAKATVSHIEVARRQPTRDLLEALAGALDTSVPALLAEARERVPSPSPSTLGAVAGAYAAAGVGVVQAARRGLQDKLADREEYNSHGAQASPLPGWVREQPVGLTFEQAEAILRSSEAVAALVGDVDRKLVELQPRLGDDVVAIAELMARLVTCYADGQYRACRHETAALLVGALSYLTTDDDAIPDAPAETGAADDIGVLVFAAHWAADELAFFERWLPTVEPG
jgi:transcriptional regulator with XRE-family HTH domain